MKSYLLDTIIFQTLFTLGQNIQNKLIFLGINFRKQFGLSLIILICFNLIFFTTIAQTEVSEKQKELETIDSIYIQKFQQKKPYKLLHAEPLFIDLIRDLGARKGEREWNIGLGITDNLKYDSYTTLVEYEWAPVNRLGLEVELPFTMYDKTHGSPGSKLNSLKLAAQYTFLVSNAAKTSLAAGYLHEFELPEFQQYKTATFLQGHIASPFIIAAKRWDNNYHTLFYVGPLFHHNYERRAWQTAWQWNSNFHYMIPGTKNFVGVELNKEFRHADFDMTIRPQMRVTLTDQLLVGIVTGIPVQRENQRFSTFIRLIYEPKHR